MPNRHVKALFITHDVGNYGAARSLQLLLKNYDNVHIDLVFKKNIFIKDDDIREVRNKFGGKIQEIMKCYLPFDFCYKYKPESFTMRIVYRLLNKLIWQVTKKKLYSKINEGHYDFIHLNSLVLHSIISREYPFIIHIRDIFDHSSNKVIQNVSNAKGVIFIDEATREPFHNIFLPHSIVLNNPFDMTPIKGYSDAKREKINIKFHDKTVFSMIGAVTEKKGVLFVINCFLKLKNDDARLLIVGRGDADGDNFLEKCRKNAKEDKRIIFWGEEDDILQIYSISDYILRGEEYQCIGRTIYEGLYSGCSVIVPADEKRLKPMFEFDKYKDHIYYYPPRHASGLLAIFERLSHVKACDRVFYSNVNSYVKEFHKFVANLKK